MFIIESYSVAVVVSVITMLCWGSWPNTQKLTDPGWRFELFYWDYVWGIALSALLFGLTLGSSGASGNPVLTDLAQADSYSVLSALLGGVIFNAANILFVAAIALAGIAVAFPVAAGFGLVLGVLINYIARPVDNAALLLTGTALIVMAIVFSALSYRKLMQQQKITTKGLLFSLAAGLLFGFFYRFISAAMYTDFQFPESGRMGPYAAVICFAGGVLISNLLFNPIIMKKPIQGHSLTWSDYRKGNMKNHLMGMLGGIIWGTGLVLSILSAGKAGFAISFGLGQGNAMVAAIWGVFVWKEFRNAPAKTSWFIFGMFFCYIAGLACIVFAKE